MASRDPLLVEDADLALALALQEEYDLEAQRAREERDRQYSEALQLSLRRQNVDEEHVHEHEHEHEHELAMERKGEAGYEEDDLGEGLNRRERRRRQMERRARAEAAADVSPAQVRADLAQMDADEALARAWQSQIDEEFAAALVTPVAPIRSAGRRGRRAGGADRAAETLLVSPLADLFVFPSRLRASAADAVWGPGRTVRPAAAVDAAAWAPGAQLSGVQVATDACDGGDADDDVETSVEFCDCGDADDDEYASEDEDAALEAQLLAGSGFVPRTRGGARLSTAELARANAVHLEERVAAVRSGDMSDLSIPAAAYARFLTRFGRGDAQANRVRSMRSDRATHDRVMDTGARLVLFRLLDAAALSQIDGVVAAGKESHVYHAVLGERSGEFFESTRLMSGDAVAIKLYDQRIEAFHNRLQYFDGERRFRSASTSNNRQIVRLWAEKELRNLKRMRDGGVQAPEPLLMRRNMVVMEFVGRDGVPAPRLRDVGGSASFPAAAVYAECAHMMRTLFRRCRLVHADLSEYNMLWDGLQLWFIDVAQAVESDHPNALEFLRRDVTTVTRFFGRVCGGDPVLSARALFNYVVDVDAAADDESALDRLLADASQQFHSGGGGDEESDDDRVPSARDGEAEEAESESEFLRLRMMRRLSEVSDADVVVLSSSPQSSSTLLALTGVSVTH